MKRLLLALAAASLLGGCATIVGSETQSVRIDSIPQGAAFVVQDETGRPVAEGVTPKTVELAKSNGSYFGKKSYLVMLERPGYVPLTLPLKEKANLWYILGNIPLGGFPGWLLVDPFYGGMYNIAPAQVRPVINPVGARGG
ncbi:hypothetical protein [Mixta intestinalis]|jgi:hypothetical protein|uniref:PEGA domain-containing protein n=1 Tax=Mixta intestinalis TaxID=1615494 RepID=A0A6P1PZS6_9GAMM|nr:hypothetical protein [Mixta intestinalis]QHM72160.1 hypothetical protein C7M51_02460 [Mixta intestinalis]